ncbi:MAG: ATP-binding protein [Chryseolinea sp.]
MSTYYLIVGLILILAGKTHVSNGMGELQSVTLSDTLEVIRLYSRSGLLRFQDTDSSLLYAEKAVELARQLKYVRGECIALNFAGEELRMKGDYPKALEAFYGSLEISRASRDQTMESFNSTFIGSAYVDMGDYRQGLRWLHHAIKLNEGKQTYPGIKAEEMRAFTMSNMARAYTELNLPDSALSFASKAFGEYEKLESPEIAGPLRCDILNEIGNVYWIRKDYEKAKNYYRQVAYSELLLNSGFGYTRLAEYFLHVNVNLDSSLYHARRALAYGIRSRQKPMELEASALLGKIFTRKNQYDSANHYNERVIDLTNTVFGREKINQLQLLAIDEQQKNFEIRRKEEDFRSSLRSTVLLSLVAVALVLAFIFYRNQQQKNKINKGLEAALDDLRSTQKQLIQSEKMASLGELTAGIAHEIQNPLNFVNNFSELNSELIDDLEKELSSGKADPASIKELTDNIKSNQEKINHHGKRAEGIVKSMLQHSRSSSGQKQLTDINLLCDEYLRLAYHGYRAKDKSFNVEYTTHFDSSLPKLNLVPQDIGRVVLNLINNAFYAVNEKSKQDPSSGFKPLVEVSTRRQSDKVEIRVKDNGMGIPDPIKEKIFQPFFTTKPTGQGTGLGLSLSYDIVTKGHGGKLIVFSESGNGCEFVIELGV